MTIQFRVPSLTVILLSLSSALLAATTSSTATAATQTYIVDDKTFAIDFQLPEDCPTCRWTMVDIKYGINENCFTMSNCQSRDMDVTQVHGGSWTEGSDAVTGVFKFRGTGVEAFFVLRNRLGDVTDVTFTVDNQTYSRLYHNGTGGDPYTYNYRAFGISGLQYGVHTFVMQGGSPNLFEVDYLVVSGPDPSGTYEEPTAVVTASIVTETQGQISFSGMHAYTPSTSSLAPTSTANSNAARSERVEGWVFALVFPAVLILASWT